MESYTVYKHISPSNKVYIGITKGAVEKRWNCGFGYRHNQYFFNAIRKYGWDNIEHKIVASGLSLENASQMEKDLISFYKQQGISYNIAEGGLDGFTRPRTKQEKENLSAFFKEYFKTHEHPLKGKKHSNESKLKMSIAAKRNWKDNYEKIYKRLITLIKVGVYNILTKDYTEYSSEKDAAIELNVAPSVLRRHVNNGRLLNNLILFPVDKLSFEEAMRRTYQIEKMNIHKGGKEIGVVQIDLTGKFINAYRSAKEAGEKTGIRPVNIGKACRGEIKQSGNCIWMFQSEYNKYIKDGNLLDILDKKIQKCEQRKEICMTPIIQKTLDGTPIQVYKGGMDVHRKLGFDSSSISKCCRGKLPKAYGFKWEYITKEEYEQIIIKH